MIVLLNVAMALFGFIGSFVALCYKTLDEKSRRLTKHGVVAAACLTATFGLGVAKEIAESLSDANAQQEKRQLIGAVSKVSATLTEANQKVADLAEDIQASGSELTSMASDLAESSKTISDLSARNQTLNQRLLSQMKDVPKSVKAILGQESPVRYDEPSDFQRRLSEFGDLSEFRVMQYPLMRANDSRPIVLDGTETIEYHIRYRPGKTLHRFGEIRNRLIEYEDRKLEHSGEWFDRRKLPVAVLIVGKLRYPLTDFNGEVHLENRSSDSVNGFSESIDAPKLEMLGNHQDWTVGITVHTMPSLATPAD